MKHFENFCLNVHQDSGEEYGYELEQLVYGTASNFRKEELEEVLSDIAKALKDNTIVEARKASERLADIELIRQGNERADLMVMGEVIKLTMKDGYEDYRDVNRRLDLFSIDN